MIIITQKITNKEERFTMVNLFSTWDKAREHSELFFANLSKEEQLNFNRVWGIDTESVTVDDIDKFNHLKPSVLEARGNRV